MLNPKDASILTQADGYLELDLPRQAVEVLAKASPAARSSFEWNFAMGEAHRVLENHEAAIPYLRAARRHQPLLIPIYVSLGWCYKRTGALDRAIQTLLEAEEHCREKGDADHHALVMYNLSCYYALKRQTATAVDWLSRAMEKEPSYRDMIADERDFDPIRGDRSFKQLIDPRPTSDRRN